MYNSIIKRSENIKRIESIRKLVDIEKLESEIKNKKVIIYGTQEVAEFIGDTLITDGFEIDFYVDSENLNQGSLMYNNKKVYSTYELMNENNYYKSIVIASFQWQDAVQLLKDLNIQDKYTISIPFKDENINYNLNYKTEYNVHSPVIETYEDFEVKFGTDKVGRVIIDNKKEEVYRIIYKSYEKHVLSVFNTLSEHNMIGNMIIDTKLANSNDIIKRNERISEKLLKHQYVKTTSIPKEFSKRMFKDAGLFMLQLIEDLHNVGLTLQKANINDVVFFNGAYKYIDFGSIVLEKKGIDVNFVNEFIENFINVLLYMCKVQKFKNTYLRVEESININDFIGFLNEDEKNQYFENKNRVFEGIRSLNSKVVVNALREWLLLCDNTDVNTNWTNYHKNKKNNASSDVEQKDNAIFNIINEISIDSAIDIGGNSGHYSYILADRGVNCILTDIDSSAVDNAYSFIKENKINKVLPMVKDFKDLSNSTEDIERLKSDLVMMLALEHHLVFAQQLTFDKIINTCYELSNKYLVIEFINKEDNMIKDFNNPMFNWYSREKFEKSLANKFQILNKVRTEEHRIAYLCSK